MRVHELASIGFECILYCLVLAPILLIREDPSQETEPPHEPIITSIDVDLMRPDPLGPMI